MMKTKTFVSCFALLFLAGGIVTAGPLGTSFTYQGRLADGNTPANGSYDLRFALYDGASGPAQIGNALTNAATGVTNGLFTVMLDFGSVFDGNALWLEIAVRTNGSGTFTTLTPRQLLSAAPYAVYAPSAGAAATATIAASANSVAAANVSGTLALNQLPGAVVTNNASGVTLGGSFTGSGTGLTSVNADQVDGQHGAYYQNAANLASGTLADARLSTNVPLLNTNQVFSASNRFAGVVVMTNTANTIVGAFSGNGAALTNLSGAAIASGTVSMSRLPTGLLTNNASDVTLTGSFSGNGAGVTNVNLVTVNSQGALEWTVNWGNFVLASSPSVGLSPYSVAAADVNSDGKADLISANSSADTLSVLINNGSGGFVASSPVAVGRTPIWVTAADVGGNNKPDLISANSGTNTLTVVTNNGSGQFVLAATLTVGNEPNSVVAADVNSDGRLDLISANKGGNSLSVLTNGNTGFSLSATLAVGPTPNCVAAADVNGDGKVDLISANSGFNTLTVLTNNGSGGFVLASSPFAGSFPASVAAADLNGDGKLDLVAANPVAETLSVLTNNGSGGFVAAFTLPGGYGPFAVLATDVTGDGRVDLVSANYANGTTNTLTLLTNNGSGGFGSPIALMVGTGPHSVAAADVNGDGKADLISANAAPCTLSVLFNTPFSTQANFIGNGANLNNLNAANLTGTAGNLTASNVNVLGSITGNGGSLTNLNASQLATGIVPLTLLPGAVVTNNETGLNLGGTFSGNGAAVTNVDLLSINDHDSINWTTNWGTFLLASSPGLGIFLSDVINADVNADGKPDLITANYYANTLSVLTNNGSGGFVLAASPAVGSHPDAVAAADVNGDGRVDLISANYNANTLSVLTNNGSGGFIVASSPAVGSNPDALTAADVNGDARVDLISANYTSSTLSVLTNNGSGGFVLASSPAVGYPSAVAAADVNGDGRVDLISANLGTGILSVLTNNGGGGFVMASSPAVGASPQALAVVDLNGDGRLDLITADSGVDRLSVLTNSGSGTFVLAFSLAVGDSPQSVTAVDVNRDGKVDLISANYYANTLSVLTSTVTGNFVLAATLTVGSSPCALTAGDFNGDGMADLTSANSGAGTLSVLFNTPIFDASFTGDGSSLQNLNASHLAAGTLALARLPGAVVTNNASAITLSGTFSGNGGGLTNLDAADLTGTIADARLSTNVALLNASQTFTGSNRFAGAVTLTNAANAFVGNFTGNGAGVTNLSGTAIVSGTVPLAQIPAAVVTNNATGVNLTGTFSGNGGNLTNLNASQLMTGTVPLTLLPGAVVTNNESGVTLTGTFAGNGGGLTNLNATQLTGIVPLAQLPAAVVTNNQSGVNLSGLFTGNGGALTNLNAARLTGTLSPNNIAAGTISSSMLTVASNWVTVSIVNPSPAADDQFGWSVAALGTDRVLIGTPNDDTGAADAGAVYLLSAKGALLATFTNPAPAASDYFGKSVAAMGTDRVLIGTPQDDTGAANAGVAYLFNTNGVLLTTFTNPAVAAGENFGNSVAAVGPDRVLIGAPYRDAGASSAGAAYLFNTNGVLLTTFINPTPGLGDEFGWSVAAIGTDRVLIGTPGDDLGATNTGAAYLFGTNGALLATFADPTPNEYDNFGYCVAAVGSDRVLIGDPTASRGASYTGAAYLFSMNGTLLITFTNPTPAIDDSFGHSVAAVGTDRVLIGASGDSAGAVLAGVAYLYTTNGNLRTTFANPTPQNSDHFGYSVAVGGDRLLIGAHGDSTGASHAGAVYVLSPDFHVAGLIADGVSLNSITTDNLADGAVTAAKVSGVLLASQIPDLDAAKITSGTLSDARLSGNVALLNRTNAFTATNRFAGVLQATNVNNQLTGAFTGNGGGLTNLSATTLTGTVADARLSTNVALLNGTNVFTREVTFTGALYGSAPYLKYAEVTANVAAGASVAGTNNWRVFNLELTDTHSLGSTNGAGGIVLPAGTYQCRISAPAFRIQTHQIRLRTSAGVNLLFGTMGYSDESTGGSEDRSQIDGQFTLAASTTLRVQQWCSLARATDGLGTLVSFDWGDANQTVYAVAEFWKIR